MSDPAAEAVALAMEARRLGGPGSRLGGMVTSHGRLVVPVAPGEQEAFDGPMFDSPEDAAVWIVDGDDEEAAVSARLYTAIMNWKRLADVTRTTEELLELGNDIVAAFDEAAGAVPLQEWYPEEGEE